MNARWNRHGRRIAAWVALAVTLIAAPGTAIAACGCLPRAEEPESACVHCGPRAVPDGGARLERTSCCGARAVHQAPAIVAAPVALDRSVAASPLASIVVAPATASPALATATGRAPPSAFSANAPPPPYLTTFLRL